MKLHLAPPGTNEAGDETAVLDEAHIGNINGALGTIAHGDTAPRAPASRSRSRRCSPSSGPGLIVMAGDNDAGAFATYAPGRARTTAPTSCGPSRCSSRSSTSTRRWSCAWARSGVGHARLIFERFGRFWGAFSVIDLFILNALTIVTEFIGISLAVNYSASPRSPAVVARRRGDHRGREHGELPALRAALPRRWSRLSCSIPIFLLVHPPLGQVAHDFVVPSIPGGHSRP